MSIRFNCDDPECGKGLAVPDGASGKKVKCRHCGKVQVIPEPLARPADASPMARAGAFSPAPPGADKPAKGGKIRQYYPDTRQKYAAEAGTTARYVKIGVLLTVLGGLVVLGAIFIPKLIATSRRGLDSYYNPVVETKHIAERTVAQSDLNNVRKALEYWHNVQGGYPNSLEDLVHAAYMKTTSLRPSAPDGQPYVYLPGQTDQSDPTNILVYEPTAVRDMHNVIRRDLSSEMITPERLVNDLMETKRKLGMP
jgi:hypothetical protein